LEKGTDVKAKDDKGFTALILASAHRETQKKDLRDGKEARGNPYPLRATQQERQSEGRGRRI
jgi:hypothetical protein